MYPQCANCLFHFKSQRVLDKHVCGEVMESHDVLSNAMRHANEMLAKIDFSVDGAITQASNRFDCEKTYVSLWISLSAAEVVQSLKGA